MGNKSSKKRPTRAELNSPDAIKTQKEILINLNSDTIVPRLRTNPYEDYTKIAFLGEGSYASVIKVKNKFTGHVRAMKDIQKSANCTEADDKEIFNEINVLKDMDHPNIMKIFEFYAGKNSYQIITELCAEGELFDDIINNGPHNEEYCAYVMYQILQAVNYCHEMKIIHRDLKPENILIAGKEKNGFPFIKISDFGTAVHFEKGQIQRKTIGTSYYIAPEVLKKSYDQKCDIWSCGVIFYILLSQVPPFPGKEDDEILRNVYSGKYDLNFGPFLKCSPECISLLKSLLTYDPKYRISAGEALEHNFFKKYKTKEALNKVSDRKMVNQFIKNLKSYRRLSIIGETALAYLVHNFSQRKDIVNAGRLFNQFDLSIDGKITKDELLAALKARLGDQGNLKEEVDAIFKNIDSNNNGFIEYEEFIRAVVDKESFLDEKILRFAFRYFDKDNSGVIDYNEVKQVFQTSISNGVEVEQALAKIVSEVDINKDGEISFAEFETIMKKMLK